MNFTNTGSSPFSTFVPTMKISSNHSLAVAKANWIDFDAAEKDENALFDLVLQTAGGNYRCKSEDIREIAFFKTGVTL